MLFKFIMLAFMISISCTSCTSEKNPVIPPEEKYQTLEIERNLPYLFFDSDDNPIILFGQDTVSCSGYGETDGEFDLIYFVKYNSSDEKIINNKPVLTTNAIIDIAVFYEEKQNQLVIVWLDPRNNPDFIANHSPTYVDVYYKIIDTQGDIIQEDTKLTNELIEHRPDALSFSLNSIYKGTMEDIKSEEILCDTVTSPISPSSWIEIDSKWNEHHFRIIGRHWDDACKMIYTKSDNAGKVLIKDKELIEYEKLLGEPWGPNIQNLYIAIDNNDNIHSVWKLNDGTNHFYFYYLKLDDNGEIVIYEMIGEKYPNII